MNSNNILFFQDNEESDSEGDQYSTASETDAVSWLKGTWDRDGKFHLGDSDDGGDEPKQQQHQEQQHDDHDEIEHQGSSSDELDAALDAALDTSGRPSLGDTVGLAKPLQLSIRWKPGEISETNDDDDLTPPKQSSSSSGGGEDSSLSSRDSSSRSSSFTGSTAFMTNLWRKRSDVSAVSQGTRSIPEDEPLDDNRDADADAAAPASGGDVEVSDDFSGSTPTTSALPSVGSASTAKRTNFFMESPGSDEGILSPPQQPQVQSQQQQRSLFLNTPPTAESTPSTYHHQQTTESPSSSLAPPSGSYDSNSSGAGAGAGAGAGLFGSRAIAAQAPASVTRAMAPSTSKALPTVREDSPGGGIHKEDDGLYQMDEPLDPKARYRALLVRRRRHRIVVLLVVAILLLVAVAGCIFVFLRLSSATQPQQEQFMTRAPTTSTTPVPTPIPSIPATPNPTSDIVMKKGAGADMDTSMPSSAPTDYNVDDIPEWIVLGNPVPGHSVEISGDSRIVAVLSDSTLQVYHWVTTADDPWQPLGQDVAVPSSSNNNNNNGNQKVPFALSHDGSTLAMAQAQGQVLVWRLASNTWVLVGVVPSTSATQPISDIELSRDGSVVAVAVAMGPNGQAGHLRLLRYSSIEQTWSLIGGTEVATGLSITPREIAINADGSVVAFSTVGGVVQIYRYNKNDSVWRPFGQTLEAPDHDIGYGRSLSLSHIGLIVAVGGTSSARVLQYHTDHSEWRPLGGNISTDDGSIVSLSEDGITVAVGGTGRAKVYEFLAGGWRPILNANGGSGTIDVSLSNAGSTLAVSSGGEVAVLGHPDALLLQSQNPPLPVNELSWSALGTEVQAEIVSSSSGGGGGGDNNELHPQSLAISGDGLIMALADPTHLRLLHYRNNRWSPVEKSSQINEQVFAVSISRDGYTVAFAARTSDGCSVRVVKLESNGWSWLGQPIDIAAATNPKSAISISEDGMSLALGVPSYTANKGSVSVFSYDGNISWWLPLGQILTGEHKGDLCGASVSLSFNGNTLAFGCPGTSNSPSGFGMVKVFSYQANGWVSLGQELKGRFRNIRYGVSVSLSGAGTRLAVGAPGDAVGQSYVLELEGSSWVSVGNVITSPPTSPDDDAGRAVALSSDGSTLVVGAPNGQVVRVLNQAPGGQWQIIGNFDSTREGFGSLVAISVDGGVVAVGGAHVGGDRHYVRVLQQQENPTSRHGQRQLRQSTSFLSIS